ncbi:pyrroline-5-carboxylate reductase family protein [Hwanghaeella sp.]|uniref:pyrroline-5-carboxylate reductase family protein n=1 Tax=Hwanghaeella sp. TaxID=2605943 RepID=UPI003CCB9F6E
MHASTQRIGFIGVGHLARCLISGFLKSGLPAERLLLSPRGQSKTISNETGIEVAASNAALVDACDIVFLAVRPANAADAVDGLPWRKDKFLVSACAGVPIAALAARAQAPRIIRVMPVTAAEIGASPTVCYPSAPRIEDLIAHLGPVIPLSGEQHFETATVSAAVYGWVQKLIQVSADWSSSQGLSPDTARQLSAGIFSAAGQTVAASDEPMEELLHHLATPGGITELGLNHLENHHVSEAWTGACQAVIERLSKN